MTREAAPDICCLQIQESEIKTMRKMCLSPALEVALRWLAATSRAQHTAGKGPVSPAPPGESQKQARATEKGARCHPAAGQGQGAECQDCWQSAGHREESFRVPVTAVPRGCQHSVTSGRGLGRLAPSLTEVHLLYGPQKPLRRDGRMDRDLKDNPRTFPCIHNSLL